MFETDPPARGPTRCVEPIWDPPGARPADPTHRLDSGQLSAPTATNAARPWVDFALDSLAQPVGQHGWTSISKGGWGSDNPSANPACEMPPLESDPGPHTPRRIARRLRPPSPVFGMAGFLRLRIGGFFEKVFLAFVCLPCERASERASEVLK